MKHTEDFRRRHNLYQQRQREKNISILKNLKINGCAICGYNKCIEICEFHHVNSEDKKFNPNHATIGKKEFFDELQKCILLCPNCHREIHAKAKKDDIK